MPYLPMVKNPGKLSRSTKESGLPPKSDLSLGHDAPHSKIIHKNGFVSILLTRNDYTDRQTDS